MCTIQGGNRTKPGSHAKSEHPATKAGKKNSLFKAGGLLYQPKVYWNSGEKEVMMHNQ